MRTAPSATSATRLKTRTEMETRPATGFVQSAEPAIDLTDGIATIAQEITRSSGTTTDLEEDLLETDQGAELEDPAVQIITIRICPETSPSSSRSS